MAGKSRVSNLKGYIDPDSFRGSRFDLRRGNPLSPKEAAGELCRRLADMYDPSIPTRMPSILVTGAKGNCLTLASAMASSMRILLEPRNVYVVIGSRKGLAAQEVHAWALIRSGTNEEWLVYDPAVRELLCYVGSSFLARVNAYVMFDDESIFGSSKDMFHAIAGVS